MEVVKVTTWNHLKRILVLAEQYHKEIDVYDCTFPILAGEMARMISSNKHVMYMVVDGTIDIGYVVLYYGEDLVYSTLWLDTLYITKSHRGQGIIQKQIIPLVKHMVYSIGVKHLKYQATIPKEKWEHVTGMTVREERVMVIDNDQLKE